MSKVEYEVTIMCDEDPEEELSGKKDLLPISYDKSSSCFHCKKEIDRGDYSKIIKECIHCWRWCHTECLKTLDSIKCLVPLKHSKDHNTTDSYYFCFCGKCGKRYEGVYNYNYVVEPCKCHNLIPDQSPNVCQFKNVTLELYDLVKKQFPFIKRAYEAIDVKSNQDVIGVCLSESYIPKEWENIKSYIYTLYPELKIKCKENLTDSREQRIHWTDYDKMTSDIPYADKFTSTEIYRKLTQTPDYKVVYEAIGKHLLKHSMDGDITCIGPGEYQGELVGIIEMINPNYRPKTIKPENLYIQSEIIEGDRCIPVKQTMGCYASRN